ncbi:hypothetical protein [Wenxinia saemankumensis]|uniref:Uncharacterized protein n=1 Tax=Wenxinia saemankumensis TaxID=1447782 RepID=A0A1M6FKL6_9RHOB|nr:hypothetical protein [Wenxinia saemankumensis]SHI98159.1 hypothetical protein SAMN05444417_2367 [Wenxinia saemankumensis]
MERSAILDEMIEFAMEALLSGEPLRRRRVVRDLAHRWPDESAHAISFALTSATALIEDTFRDAANHDPVVPLGYRLSALISADIHAIQAMGQSPARAGDLLHFWRRADPGYLDVQ